MHNGALFEGCYAVKSIHWWGICCLRTCTEATIEETCNHNSRWFIYLYWTNPSVELWDRIKWAHGHCHSKRRFWFDDSVLDYISCINQWYRVLHNHLMYLLSVSLMRLNSIAASEMTGLKNNFTTQHNCVSVRLQCSSITPCWCISDVCRSGTCVKLLVKTEHVLASTWTVLHRGGSLGC